MKICEKKALLRSVSIYCDAR